MGNVFRVINYDGDIEISIYKKANAVFKTNEYKETEDICIEKETINIFNLLKENQELKKQLEEYKEQVNKGLYNTCLPYTTGYNKAIKDKEIQQKEFIEWLEDKIQQQETLMAENQEKLYFLMYEDGKENLKLSSQKAYTRRIILEEILQKYKSIIGGNKDE